MTGQVGQASRADVVHLAFGFATLVRRRFTERMTSETWARTANLRPGCFGVLRTVHGAHKPISQREVAERTGIDASDVVDLVDRLERAGFLRRERDQRDRRRHALVVTAKGRRAMERFTAVARAVDADVLEALDPAEREQLAGLLSRVVADGAPRSPRA